MERPVRFPDHARAVAWLAMRTLSTEYGHFTATTIATLASAEYRPVAAWIDFLLREHVVGPAVGSRRGSGYVVEVNGAVPPPGRLTNGRYGQQQRQIWAAMRKLRSWKPHDLANAASTEEIEVAVHAVRTYARALQNVGLIEDRRGYWRMKPSADTGPRAPIISPEGVFDLNTGQLVNLNGSAASRRAA